MPGAVVHEISEPLPGALVVDTNFLVKAINRRDSDHARAHVLYRRLVDEGTVCAFAEHVLHLEFWWAWQRAVRELDSSGLERLAREARQVLTGQLELGVTSPARGSAREQREYVLGSGERLLDLHLSYLTTTKVRLTKRLMSDVRDAIVWNGLKPLDGVIAAVARAIGLGSGQPPAVATLDNDFRRVDGLHVWGLRVRRRL